LVHPKVKAATLGGAGGTVVGALISIALFYVTPLVPAEIQQPVTLLVTVSITALCAALGSFLAGYYKSGFRQ
jgi:ABC-type uncharacterized transport system permease subunit